MSKALKKDVFKSSNELTLISSITVALIALFFITVALPFSLKAKKPWLGNDFGISSKIQM